MDFKKLVPVAFVLFALVGGVSAAYSGTYAASDLPTLIIDFIGYVVVGMVDAGDEIGQAIAYTISIGLFLGLLYLLMKYLSKYINWGRGIGGR